MCNEEQILHSNEHGSIIWCPNCDSLQLEYKVLVLAFKPAHLQMFLDKIDYDLGEAKDMENENLRFQFTTPVKSIHLNFTRDELEELQELVSVSLLQRELKKMFSDVSK